MATHRYGRRGGLRGTDAGARKVATTYGKTLHRTHSEKMPGEGMRAVDCRVERLFSHMLTIDPAVTEFHPQGFSVDLLEGRILRSPEQVKEARARHRRGTGGHFLYTPDVVAQAAFGVQTAVEIKLEGFEGDEAYCAKLDLARSILVPHGVDLVKIVFPRYWLHPLESNLPLLSQASRRFDLRPDEEMLDRIEQLEQDGACTLGCYLRGLGLSSDMSPVLVAFGALSVDVMTQVMKGDTPAAPAYGCLDHLRLMPQFAQ